MNQLKRKSDYITPNQIDNICFLVMEIGGNRLTLERDRARGKKSAQVNFQAYNPYFP